MKIVPKPDQLKWLSKEDQAYWRGYFAARMQYDHRWRADLSIKAALDEKFKEFIERDAALSRNTSWSGK